MKGSTFKRCTSCDRIVKGRRCTHCRSTGVSWGYVVDVGKDGDGKRRQRRRTGFATEGEANEALQEVVTSLADATFVAQSKVTLAEYLDERWLPAVQPPNTRESTWVEYARMTRLHVGPRVGGVGLQDLDPSHLNRMYAELLSEGRVDGAGGLSVKSVRNIHLMLGKALGDAVRWGLLRRNVAPLSDPPPARAAADERRAKIAVWEAAELAAFLEHIRDDHLYALWVLYATTEMRRGEGLGLRWRDVDFGMARLSVRQELIAIDGVPKIQALKSRHSVRTIDLDDDTTSVLRAHRKQRAAVQLRAGSAWEENGLVFTRDDGHWQNPDWVGEQFRRHVAVAGLPRIRPHDLRHTHATLLSAGRCEPEGRVRAARPSLGCIHAGHLRPRDARNATRGGQYLRFGSLRLTEQSLDPEIIGLG